MRKDGLIVAWHGLIVTLILINFQMSKWLLDGERAQDLLLPDILSRDKTQIFTEK